MTSAHERPPKPKKKHRLREVTDPETVAAIQRNGWTDPIGGKHTDGKVYVDTKLNRQGEKK